ncbi:MAG: cell division protein FtsK [Desulfobulbus propionicus]|nr:MAG: cell division protein FtsK [Desulfobulbus propionicus]
MARSLEAFEKTRATDTTNAACLPEAESRPAAHAEPCTGPSETAVPTSSVHQQEGINQQSASLEPGQSERYPQSAIDSGDSLASALPETALGFPPAGADGTVPFSSTSWGRQRGDDAFTAPVPQYPEGDSCSDQEADTVVPAAPASPAGDQDETERRAIPIVSPAMGAAVEPESTTTDAVQQRAIPPVSDKQAVSESSAQSVPPESPTPPELDTERRPARPADEEQLEVGSREADSSSLLVADVAGYSAPWESSPAELAPGNAYADTETAEDFSDATDAYQLPLLTFLRNTSDENLVDQNRIRSDAELLEKKLGYFGIKGEVMGISPGPVITTYEYKPDPGIKISKIVNLADDLALALSAFSIRIVAPIPGKDVMGIEIPNIQKSLVPFIDIVTSEVFSQSTSRLPICLGKDIVGAPVVVELESMPHLLIAGATGTGKSVGLNAMITSILYRATPDEVRFLMVDPKRIELSFYNDIPHLLTPVITDMNKANLALQWLVREMDRRYNLLAHFQVRHIEQFNQKLAGSPTAQYDEHGEKLEPLPYIVVIIDELADLMMTASRDIEFSLTRLAQMARAAGIHLILATQRPSVDVLTGIIKANFPTRISFQVSSKTDSRTIIDSNGAETLLGNGDMLFVPPGSARLTRVHGTYLSEEELVDITTFIKRQRKPNYIFDVITEQEPDELVSNGVHDEYDEKYNEALDYVMTTRQASISGVQRALRVGYNRAARIIDLMEKNGVVGPSDGVKPRKVLASSLHMGG